MLPLPCGGGRLPQIKKLQEGEICCSLQWDFKIQGKHYLVRRQLKYPNGKGHCLVSDSWQKIVIRRGMVKITGQMDAQNNQQAFDLSLSLYIISSSNCWLLE
jgi:hypothetical protein